MQRFIDLSITLDSEVITVPLFMQPTIERVTHREIVVEAATFFLAISAETMAEGEGFAESETLTLTTRDGTHLDAPWQYHSTQGGALARGGRPAMTIDEVPLDWCFRPGVKLDFRHLPDGHVVSAGLVAPGVRSAQMAALTADVRSAFSGPVTIAIDLGRL